MKNKIICFIALIFAVLGVLFKTTSVYAESMYTGAFILRDTSNNWYVAFGGVVGSYSISWNGYSFSLNGITCYGRWTSLGGAANKYSSLDQALSVYDSIKDSSDLWLQNTGMGTINYIIKMRGTLSNESTLKESDNYFSNYDDYIDSITPKWYEIMWDTLKDYFDNPVPFDWFKNLINRVFGNDNNGGTISENVTISAPTLAPTPTPMPYSTVVIPKTDIVTGDTVYETNYYYINPSGTPIVTSSPPTNEPSSGGGRGGSTEYVPVDGDPFSIPTVNWLTSATIGDTNYDGIDSINEGMGSIDTIGSEYTDGMNAVQESTGTLPTSWLLLIGIAAAIPLLAGIISRFLGG